MKSLKVFFLLALLVTLIVPLSTTPTKERLYDVDGREDDLPLAESTQNTGFDESSSLRGTSRFLTQSYRAAVTCDKYPRICRLKGSQGPDCCKKRCVNVDIDRLNCGKCGNKCKFSEICCKGECVNPRSNKKHCGSCNNKCKKGSSCVYGMCSYA